MAAKLLSHSQPLSSLSLLSKFTATDFTRRHQPCFRQAPTSTRPKRLAVRLSLHDPISSSTAILHHLHTPYSAFEPAESTGYSLASYYTSLGLFVISVPGLWSLIKRSVKSKIVKKTVVGEGEGKNVPNQMAGEILSFFTRNNFIVSDRGETIT